MEGLSPVEQLRRRKVCVAVTGAETGETYMLFTAHAALHSTCTKIENMEVNQEALASS